MCKNKLKQGNVQPDITERLSCKIVQSLVQQSIKYQTNIYICTYALPVTKIKLQSIRLHCVENICSVCIKLIGISITTTANSI